MRFREIHAAVALTILAVSCLTGAVPLRAQAQPAVVTTDVGAVHGVVTTQATIPLGGVMISLFDGTADVSHVLSEGDGAFKFENLKPGRYTVTATLEGFESITTAAVVTAGQTTQTPLDLRLAMVAERVEVVAPSPHRAAGGHAQHP